MKGLLAGFAVFIFIGGCTTVDNVREFRNLDLAIEQSCQNIQKDFNESASIAVFNIASSTTRLSEYIIEEVMNNFTNMHKYNIVERSKISAIFQEQKFQFSGNVSDDTIQSLGNMLGAQFVITGLLDDLGSYYRLRLFVIAIESGERKSSTAVNIVKPNEQVAFLLSGQESTSIQTNSSPAINLIGTTWTVTIDGDDDGGIFVFNPDNALYSNAFDDWRFDGVTTGTWRWSPTPNGQILLVNVTYDFKMKVADLSGNIQEVEDAEKWRLELYNITDLKITGVLYEESDDDEAMVVELNRLR
ncbi:MAG: CsgG/HfaB family protein [Spirochaetales bacterium]|nr:CsgG/HfaB family protein [Spirochaetales bacterium]